MDTYRKFLALNGGKVEADFSSNEWTITVYSPIGKELDRLTDRGKPTRDAIKHILGTNGMNDVISDLQTFIDNVAKAAKHGNGY